jgi:hypothetical protein
LAEKKVIELELVDEYVYRGERRYRFKVKGTNIVINVRAENPEEGADKAIEVLKKIGYVNGFRGSYSP